VVVLYIKSSLIHCATSSTSSSEQLRALEFDLQISSIYTSRVLHQRFTMSTRLPSTPISIIPSPAELKEGRLDQRNLEIAVRALARDGLVVLEDMVDHATLDKLNVKMVEDAYELQARKDSPFNYNKGNIQQDPPMTEQWFSDSIYTSKLELDYYSCQSHP
jgi:hypothetical protein